MNTAIYTRVSTDDQTTASQEHELSTYCDRRGWRETKTYYDQISGAKFIRPGLDSLMAAVRAGKIERIIVFKLDRLGRSLPHLALILDELGRHNVALIATSQGIDTSNSNPVGRLQLNVLMAVAEFEREIIRERVESRPRGGTGERCWEPGTARCLNNRTPAEVLGRKRTWPWSPGDSARIKHAGLVRVGYPSVAAGSKGGVAVSPTSIAKLRSWSGPSDRRWQN